MSCIHRRNAIMRDLDRVRILAQATADLTGVEQIIYKTWCDGIQIYKYSYNWPGTRVETVRPNRQDTSEDILQDSEYEEIESTESDEYPDEGGEATEDVG